jgi:hypothetical protein
VRVESDRGIDGFVVGIEHPQRTRRASIGDRVDQYQCGPVLEQVVGQVHAADPVVDHLDRRAREVAAIRTRPGMSDYLGSEAVVTEEYVADTGHEDSWRHSSATGATCSGS